MSYTMSEYGSKDAIIKAQNEEISRLKEEVRIWESLFGSMIVSELFVDSEPGTMTAKEMVARDLANLRAGRKG